jgi:lysophospholipase L1-like esterase
MLRTARAVAAAAALVHLMVGGSAPADTSRPSQKAPPPPPPPPPVLWLPLGDSITWGCGTDAAPRGAAKCVNDAGGYRVPLAWALSQRGINVSTMGTLQTGPAYVPASWLRHEGHPGARIDQIGALLEQSLASAGGRLPDVVTIHLGTNDCGQNASQHNITAVMLQRLDSLLSKLHAGAPSAVTYLASIIGFPLEPDWITCNHAYNEQLPSVVSAWRAKDMDIRYVPMEEDSGVCVGPDPDHTKPLSGYCCDFEVHPTAAGYLRMASVLALSIAETPSAAQGSCGAELAALKCRRGDKARCSRCAEQSSKQLLAANCTEAMVVAWCEGH